MAIESCHWHSDRDTGLHCGRCSKPICVECMRQHPVGVRCKDCLVENRLPISQVSPAYIAKGTVAAVALGLVGMLALGTLLLIFPAAGFFFFILMTTLGFAIGEGVGFAVNHRKGRHYQYMAVGGVLLATAPIALISLFAFTPQALMDLIGIGIALSVAWQRRAI